MSNTSMDEEDKPHIPMGMPLPHLSVPRTRSATHIVYPRLRPSHGDFGEMHGMSKLEAALRPLLWYRVLRVWQ